MDIEQQIKQTKSLLHKLVLDDWLKNDIFHIRWFGAVGFILLSYFIVFKLLDKGRLTQIFLFGSLMTVSMAFFDVFGTQFGLWSYITRIFPFVPSLFFFDYTLFPLYYMLVYQYSSTWKSFAVWNAVLAGIISFGIYPVLVALKMLSIENWRYIYFFPIIFATAFLCRGVVWYIMSIQIKKTER